MGDADGGAHADAHSASAHSASLGVYSYHTEGRYYFKREQADTFKKLLGQCRFDPPLWVLLTTDAAIVLPLRISADAVPALGQRWRRLEELTGLRRTKGGGAKL
jgi:hypothetical protein